MKNELLHFFVPEKGRRTKRQPISWLCCWAILLGIVCNACSDDDPVKKNPYLQVSTRALLKEVVEVKFNNIDGNTDITVDFGDGTVKEGKAANPITYAYTQSGDYTLHVTAGQYEVQKRIRIYNLLALTEALRKCLAFIENLQYDANRWAIFQNYKNVNREAPLVRKIGRAHV